MGQKVRYINKKTFPARDASTSYLAGVHREECVRKYDTTFIVDGDLGQDEREAIILKFKESLEKNGAEVDRIVRWGMRTLAYEINKKSRGYYVIFYYAADPKIIKGVERDLRLNENVLRYMTILFDGPHPSYIPDEGEPGTSSAQAPAPVPAAETPADDDTSDEDDDAVTETEAETSVETDEVADTDADTDTDAETAAEEDAVDTEQDAETEDDGTKEEN